MKLIVPDYYQNFRCIASACKNSCCIGWEIDIDEDTIEYYNSIDSKFGARLCNSISHEGGTPHFRLDKNERCPFLNKNNLCDIITELSEDALCNICADHPRFRNYFSDKTEMGLGLCCESAAAIIISKKDKINLVNIEDDFLCEEIPDDEKEFFLLRERIFETNLNRDLSIEQRMKKLRTAFEIKSKERTVKEKADFYLSLERLDESWGELLEKVRCVKNIPHLSWNKEEEIIFENLLHYFIYRHLAGCLDDERFKERLNFALESVEFLMILCAYEKSCKGELLQSDVENFARMYSSEVEYSEENLKKCLDLL